MPTLALPGGTSPSLGRAIVAAVIAKKPASPWNVVILSRSSRIPTWLQAIDPQSTHTTIRTVDYLSVESLAAALHDVHAVISVTSAIDGTQAEIQINLLHAALRAGCKRFAPSQWGFGPKGWENVPTLRWGSQGIWNECTKHKCEIECANFNHGSFMNYLGHGIYPSPPKSESDEATTLIQLRKGEGYMPGVDEACQGLQRQGPLADRPGAFLIGLKNGIAELPIKDDGQWPRITMTSLRDVGRWVTASLDLPEWEESMSMAGDTLTMGELLAHAEAITKKKFKVIVVKQEDIEKRLAGLAQDDFMGQMWAEFNLAYIRDIEDEVVLRPVLNDMCPEVKPMGVREYMEKFWNIE
ncbi:unnamed protein product [Penicillium egyptiacum]|uniref:NmrA-like domain-containing protein n=1 Tax=Penicillium egyptiacum TaxID=1303716 RepID=A0A9W4KPH8_9EURO|nr:unnamed protein product [Penicillium egyptiacum]